MRRTEQSRILPDSENIRCQRNRVLGLDGDQERGILSASSLGVFSSMVEDQMRKRFYLGLVICVATATAAEGQDAKIVLQAVAKNLGADTLKCLTFSGTGSVGLVGQNWAPEDDWPKVELASYTKIVNFDAQSAREDSVRTQGRFPNRGGGLQPIVGERRQTALVNGRYA